MLSQLETLKLGSLRESLDEVAKCLSQKSFKAENMLTPRLWGWGETKGRETNLMQK